MRIVSKWILVSAVVSLALGLCMIIGLPVMQASADHVRWDIISSTQQPYLRQLVQVVWHSPSKESQ
jgi:hypothetical protein